MDIEMHGLYTLMDRKIEWSSKWLIQSLNKNILIQICIENNFEWFLKR